ncbi:MAG: hypothetical protein LBR19_08505, partial [Bifidobacteriaceae bacterium]|nr:hypothetical protein [Bifidobacteriaceae bacterium]
GQPGAGGALEVAIWDLDPGGQPGAGGALEVAIWDLDPGGQRRAHGALEVVTSGPSPPDEPGWKWPPWTWTRVASPGWEGVGGVAVSRQGRARRGSPLTHATVRLLGPSRADTTTRSVAVRT